MRDIWALLHEFDADVIVAAHDHLYERFGKQDADGRSDAGGLRQFIVGTGGAHLYRFHADHSELAGSHSSPTASCA